MIFQSQEEIFLLLKANQITPLSVIKSREEHKELTALINGKDFLDELILKIEHLETAEKAKVRKKFSRNITDFFERLLLPIDNVFSSNGSVKKYNVKNTNTYKLVLDAVSDIKDGKSIERYVETTWMPLYHNDPNGVIFMEYKKGDKKPYPTYKSINSIRNYKAKGQTTEWIIFEPTILVGGNKSWRVVDDLRDYTIIQSGNTYVVDIEKTFEHPFGEVPALINSDIIDMSDNKRLSPIYKLIPTAKEYANNLSVKSIYKITKGVPKHWQYGIICKECRGSKKSGAGACKECNGKGSYTGNDVTDVSIVPYPEKDGAKLTPDIAGYISPDIETWKQLTEELEYLEKKCNATLWGESVDKQGNETATGKFIDTQPKINRLNKYATIAEWVEWKLSEWTINFIDTGKNKSESVALIFYGRRYIIDSPDTLLNNYLKARKDGANTTILDRLIEEYLTAKYRNDPEWLRFELTKFHIEPYTHMNVDEVKAVFGDEEAKKKIFFSHWFKSVDKTKDEKTLFDLFNADWQKEVDKNKTTIDTNVQTKLNSQAALRGSVGGVSGMVVMLQAVALGQMSEDAAATVITEMYGIEESVAKIMAKKPTNN